MNAMMGTAASVPPNARMARVACSPSRWACAYPSRSGRRRIPAAFKASTPSPAVSIGYRIVSAFSPRPADWSDCRPRSECGAAGAARQSQRQLRMGVRIIAPPRGASASGRVSTNRNVDPCPGVETTLISPSICSTMRLQMASPRPEPPKRRLMELSAWTNSSNSAPRRSGWMPIQYR